MQLSVDQCEEVSSLIPDSIIYSNRSTLANGRFEDRDFIFWGSQLRCKVRVEALRALGLALAPTDPTAGLDGVDTASRPQDEVALAVVDAVAARLVDPAPAVRCMGLEVAPSSNSHQKPPTQLRASMI